MQDMKISDLLNVFTKQELEHLQYLIDYYINMNGAVDDINYHLVGKLVEINDKELLLEKASWIADSGRFHTALKNGEFKEIEPFVNDVIINRNSIIDATIWDHSLPKEQK